MAAKPKRPFTVAFLLTIAGAGGYGLLHGLFLGTTLLTAVLIRPFPLLMQRVHKRLLRWYAASVVKHLVFFKIISIPHKSTKRPDQSSPGTIIVSNHRSRLDTFVLMWLLDIDAVIFKSSYDRLPFMWVLRRFHNFISVDATSTGSLLKAKQACIKVIQQGGRLLVFPEGTRAAGRLLAFKDLAFRLASELHCTLVPAVIHSDIPLMARRPNSVIPWRRIDFSMTVFDPMDVTCYNDPEDASLFVYKLMAAKLKQLDAGTEWESPISSKP